MSCPRTYFELRCPKCRWTQMCGPRDAARRLREARKLRPESEPEWEILYELFRSAAGQFACPECGTKGLAVGPVLEDEADWPGPKPCSSCGRAISAERLEAVPNATLCANCQRDEEAGRLKTDIEYCPKCGSPMYLRPSRSSGVTRYAMVCTATPPCRL